MPWYVLWVLLWLMQVGFVTIGCLSYEIYLVRHGKNKFDISIIFTILLFSIPIIGLMAFLLNATSSIIEMYHNEISNFLTKLCRIEMGKKNV
jgi:hypothetical protein